MDGTIGDKAEELKGQAKEAVGEATDNEDLQVEGAVEENRAEARQAVNGDKDIVALVETQRARCGHGSET